MRYKRGESKMSYHVEARCAGSEDWTITNPVFKTKKEAEQYARDVESRWTLCAETKVVRSKEKATAIFNPLTFQLERIAA